MLQIYKALFSHRKSNAVRRLYFQELVSYLNFIFRGIRQENTAENGSFISMITI